jgi:hypothetical protein
MSLLETYIGSWKGEGMLVGGQKPEPFRCRLTINKGNLNKVNYAGRCTLVDMNLSVSGTIAFDDKSRTLSGGDELECGLQGRRGRQEGRRHDHLRSRRAGDRQRRQQYPHRYADLELIGESINDRLRSRVQQLGQRADREGAVRPLISAGSVPDL